MKDSAALLSGIAVARCAPDGREPAPAAAFSSEALTALAAAILPAASLGAQSVGRVVTGFTEWLEGFRPGAELDHPYLVSSEIEYGPPDPRPRWIEQLAALERAAEARHGRGFSELSEADRRALVARELGDEGRAALPPVAEARHVAVALLAFFYSRPEATDLCYRARIERFSCRGLDTAPERPAPAEPEQ